MDKRIVEKLKKLLALAGSDNEHEASVAMQMAEALMREHNLNLADVALDGSGAAVGEAVVASMGKTMTNWERLIAVALAKAFHGESLVSRGKGARGYNSFRFVAGQTDLIIITDLFVRLRRTVNRQAAAYVKSFPSPCPRMTGRSYRIGMVTTIANRLRQLRRNTDPQDDAKNQYGMTGKELMVIKDQWVEHYIAKAFPRLVNSTIKTNVHDLAAFKQGLDDGNKVSLHRSMPDGGDSPPVLGA